MMRKGVDWFHDNVQHISYLPTMWRALRTYAAHLFCIYLAAVKQTPQWNQASDRGFSDFPTHLYPGPAATPRTRRWRPDSAAGAETGTIEDGVRADWLASRWRGPVFGFSVPRRIQSSIRLFTEKTLLVKKVSLDVVDGRTHSPARRPVVDASVPVNPAARPPRSDRPSVDGLCTRWASGEWDNSRSCWWFGRRLNR